MIPKPNGLQPKYGAEFKDQSIVSAYQHRPRYPQEMFGILSDLITDQPRHVLDVGCGTGFIARYLINQVDRIDAVDFSAQMIATGKTLPGGDDPALNWIEGAVEKVPLSPPYALITAGQCLHWMDWYIVLPRFQKLLTAGGYLALVGTGALVPLWHDELIAIVQRYSTNRDYEPYHLSQEFEMRGLFKKIGEKRTAPVSIVQAIDHYIESWHARNGLSRERMSQETAAAFDCEAKALISQYCPNGYVESQIVGHVEWGVPMSP